MSQASPSAAAAKDSGNTDQIVASALKQISHIATLPEVTVKIIHLVEDPNSTAQDLNKVITNDPALGARILKVVNSAFYGLPGQIGSTNRAIVLLGLNAVKNIAIAASLAKLFRGGQISSSFNARELWQHCIAVASATRLISSKTGIGLPDEAFLAGLIHDIGIMVEIQAVRPGFVKALTKATQEQGVTLREAEREALGASHEEFGRGLCLQWKFPSSFSYVTGFHHRPMEVSDQHKHLVYMVHLADIMAAKAGLGFTTSVETDTPHPEILAVLNLTTEDVAVLMEKLPDAANEAMALLQEHA